MLVRVTSGYFLQDLIQLDCPSNRNLVFLLRRYQISSRKYGRWQTVQKTVCHLFSQFDFWEKSETIRKKICISPPEKNQSPGYIYYRGQKSPPLFLRTLKTEYPHHQLHKTDLAATQGASALALWPFVISFDT